MDVSYLRTNSTQTVVRSVQLENISHYIYAIVFPIIFLLGLVGNVLSSLLFSITKLKKTSCGVYFLVLAIADTLGLIGGIHHCLAIGYRISVPNAYYCRVRNFFLYTSMDMASWMVVAISVDRYMKVKFPISARMYATQKLATIISCILAVVFILKNIHLATAFIGDFSADAADNCDPNPAYPNYMFFFKRVWPWIDLVSYALLPFIIVSICNAFIIHDQYKRRFKLRKRDLDVSFITLLLVCSISLIVCNLPIAVLVIIYPYISLSYDTNDTYDGVAFAFDLLRLPSYACFALNFYFYYYTSVLFRQQAVLLCKRLCRIRTSSNDIELPNRIYTGQTSFEDQVNSTDDLNDYQHTPAPSLGDSSYIPNFYRQN